VPVWVDHHRSNVELRDGKPLHNQVDAFMNGHILYCLEALSLLGSIRNGILMVNAISSMLPVSNPKDSECSSFWRVAAEHESEKLPSCETSASGNRTQRRELGCGTGFPLGDDGFPPK
jgi:hypothetical protein